MFDFANKLKSLMNSNGVTGNQLATDLNIKQPHVSQLINGKSYPSFTLLNEICAYFNISLQAFFADPDEMYLCEPTNDTSSFSISDRIVELRNSNGLTTNKLATLAGVSQSFLRQVESGDKGISVESLEKLCIALGIDLHTFFLPPLGTDFSYSEEQLLYSFRKLSSKKKKLILNLLEEIK